MRKYSSARINYHNTSDHHVARLHQPQLSVNLRATTPLSPLHFSAFLLGGAYTTPLRCCTAVACICQASHHIPSLNVHDCQAVKKLTPLDDWSELTPNINYASCFLKQTRRGDLRTGRVGHKVAETLCLVHNPLRNGRVVGPGSLSKSKSKTECIKCFFHHMLSYPNKFLNSGLRSPDLDCLHFVLINSLEVSIIARHFMRRKGWMAQ